MASDQKTRQIKEVGAAFSGQEQEWRGGLGFGIFWIRFPYTAVAQNAFLFVDF